MKVPRNSLDDLLYSLRQYFQNDTINREDALEKSPLRSDIFSMEQMEQHAVNIAHEHKISYEDSSEQLLKRLAENEEVLIHVTGLLQDVVRQKTPITPAGEWLLDNFYLIEEQIQLGKRYLPKGYSKGLPKLTSGPLAGFPRVYDIVIEIISHSDGHVDIHTLTSFISAYQKISELTLGELWAIPIMLRLALLENLRRVAARIALDRIDADLAHQWADLIIRTSENDPKNLILVLADMARSNPPMDTAFVAEFYRKLQWRGSNFALPISWIEQQLSDSSMTINGMVLAENQKQAADQVSITNSITSLRFLSKLDWREFVEGVSVVDQTLREDIDGTYSKMDFYTRDSYRHSVEEMAKRSKCSENNVARIAINLARENSSRDSSDKRKSHVGYYLIAEGKDQTEKNVQNKSSAGNLVKRVIEKNAGWIYAIGLAALTTIVAVYLMLASDIRDFKLATTIIFTIATLLSASYFSSAIVNWISTLCANPKPLPKMNFSVRIPDHARTMVVVPTIITGMAQAEKLIDDLEVRFLANRDPNLLFALLTDFMDASVERLPEDSELVKFVSERIIELNKKYHGDTFFLFHRPRQWNPKEKIWMGYERKRGKLTELNHLIRGNGADRFSVVVGDKNKYSGVKYIITLDTDTQFPREAAWKLIGLMEHPLNQPQYSEDKKKVVAGYGIIQPRIAISLHGATRSRYSKMHENDSGIDPYTRVTSDVYQDVFEEGSFIGKGIYHVDAFEKALSNRFPENRILSHDLLEGTYARCGFASDVQFYEHYPSTYHADTNRRHRWIRGDWQIAHWFFPFVPGPDKKLTGNPISSLSRWKIFDNLRRSLVPLALLYILITGWTLLESPGFWTIAIIILAMLPSLLISGWNLLWKPKEINVIRHIKNVIRDTSRTILQSVFSLMCLPYEAFINMDAIVRTLWRMMISGKGLLQWNPSGFIENGNGKLSDVYSRMWISPAVSIIITILLARTYPYALLIAAPFLVLWIAAPYVVWYISNPMPVNRSFITHEQRLYLRELSRKTWAFFENLVGPADNWLPPDNLQQYPIPVIAHRTSPTNIGLSFLSNLSAYDFGYITASQVLYRTSHAFASLEKLERYAGHLFNWYDTQSLKTLNPRYISTVDSGNLAGHLMTLRQGLLGFIYEPVISGNIRQGISDTLRLIQKSLSPDQQGTFREFMDHFEEISRFPLTTLIQYQNYLEDVSDRFATVTARIEVARNAEAHEWIQAVSVQLENYQKEIMLFEPWLTLQTSMRSELPVELPEIPSLKELSDIYVTLSNKFRNDTNPEIRNWLLTNENILHDISLYARQRISQIELLAVRCTEFATMEYEFLYDRTQHLLAIGYNVDNHHLDASFYDLLASEARLASFVAIAQGKLPQEGWFALGRRLTTAGDSPTLLSWSGSMFEYLMPLLVMPTFENTLLDETYRGTIAQQVKFGEQKRIPWGISESCYNVVDAHLTYQYKAFGIPELGFKRGLDKDLVIAPYASIMALMVDPAAATANLERLRSLGYEGKYGFYEAIDFTPTRLPRSKSPVLIRTFMVHHEGMSMLALDYLLNDQPMQRRFAADPQFQTALLMLQERVPKTIGFYQGSINTDEIVHTIIEGETRTITKTNTSIPEIQLLSNGSYHVMLTHTGGGYSRWKDIATTRWREDTTRDHWGTFIYIRDLSTNELWSAAHQPTLKETSSYEAIFSQGRAEYRRRDHDIDAHTEVAVSPEDDIEIRRVHLTNLSRSKRSIEVTSYGEVVITYPVADASHPAFSNLFVQTELNTAQHAIICTRRPRSSEETPPWMFHLMKVNHADADSISYETDRAKFIGRGRNLVSPQVFDEKELLSGSQGSVLDPIVSIQYRITLSPGETATVDILTGIAGTRSATQGLIDKYQDRHLRDRAFELSWTHSQVVLRQINATESQAQLYTKLASSVVYANPMLRATPDILSKNHRGQSALWSYSISGDLPIVLLMISETSNIDLARQMIQARAYWQLKGLTADLVILNEDSSGYRQLLQEQIQQLLIGNVGIPTGDKQGGVFVRSVDQISTEDYILFQTVARVIIADSLGSLQDQLNRPPRIRKFQLLGPLKTYKPAPSSHLDRNDLLFFNGTGGFSKDGKEYVITTGGNRTTPLPWSNVLANKNFGTITTECGSSYTWAENAHEFRLTPWSNDPVTDSSGEALYIRDEETGHFWSPMPWPVKSDSPYTARHGFGYTIYEHHHDGIASEVTVYVDHENPVKFTTVKLRNESGRSRKLTLTSYTEWVLGALRPTSSMHIVIDADLSAGTFIARNPYNSDFHKRVAFMHVDERSYAFTCDRKEFIGRNHNLQNPSAMRRLTLSGKSGAGIDPCCAIQIHVSLESKQEKEMTFRMGSGKDHIDAAFIINRFKGKEKATQALERVRSFWNETLGSIQVETPDQSLNILSNGWLLYQVLSCRFWGRSGFYQSGGAYGFRDQLQDTLALTHAAPDLTREHILLSASRQFTEGDVQHWWHPPANRGVRTLCSDDFVWLPYVTSRYVTSTGDISILDEIVPFIEGRPLHVHEESYYDLPVQSPARSSLYDHCKLAILRALRFGEHGLPLMGSGDWNDGMNMVGIEGKGESTWLGFFVYDVLIRFKKIARLKKDDAFAAECDENALQLKKNIHKNGWDGEWYIRAYFDSGAMLGTASNDECKIDSISQSWAVISGAGEPDRVQKAMESAEKYLVNRNKSIIQLLDPPFDSSELNPGYIKGYVPGVRENGGQYTHAAIWMVMAFAKLGDHKRTWELLQMINPINHGITPENVATYKVEPYVVAADVYGVSPHIGRGGWTWYTGSAGWMYQLIMESILGLRREGNLLSFDPCVPGEWKSFKIRYRFGKTTYHIEFRYGNGEFSSLTLDNVDQPNGRLYLNDDEKEHLIIVSQNVDSPVFHDK